MNIGNEARALNHELAIEELKFRHDDFEERHQMKIFDARWSPIIGAAFGITAIGLWGSAIVTVVAYLVGAL